MSGSRIPNTSQSGPKRNKRPANQKASSKRRTPPNSTLKTEPPPKKQKTDTPKPRVDTPESSEGEEEYSSRGIVQTTRKREESPPDDSTPRGKKKRARSGNNDDTPKKAAKSKPKKSDFEWSEKKRTQSDAYHVKLKPDLFDSIKERRKSVESVPQTKKARKSSSTDQEVDINKPIDIAEVGIEKTLRGIFQLGQTLLKNNEITTKKDPVEGGSVTLQQDGVNITVRLDKTKTPTVNARVSLQGVPDKTTNELANLMRKYREPEDIAAFLRGLQGHDFGKADNEIETELEWQAYQDGTEARWVAMLSDIMDNPGSSALVEQMLGGITTQQEYQALFTGGKHNEFSFGAIPSQNQFTGLDKDSNEYKRPFGAMRELLDKGQISVTDTATNQPVFRKLKVVDEAIGRGSIKMQKQKRNEQDVADMSSDQVGELFAETRKKATLTRNKISREHSERHTNVQSDDEASDEEDKKRGFFSPEQQQNRDQRASSNLRISQSKMRATVRGTWQAGTHKDVALKTLNIDVDKIKALSQEEAQALSALLDKIQKEKL